MRVPCCRYTWSGNHNKLSGPDPHWDAAIDGGENNSITAPIGDPRDGRLLMVVQLRDRLWVLPDDDPAKHQIGDRQSRATRSARSSPCMPCIPVPSVPH